MNNTHENAINQEAYYNFYQYVPHRTITNYNNEQFNQYLGKIGINDTASTYPCLDNQSVLYNLGQTFINIQNETYTNASMMFALALNESGVGKSQYAIENYNLFGHAAYDENPNNATQYTSLEDCIENHAINFLQKGYANPNDERYHGSWFGNKASGINVMYASDPYWAEKAANFYYQLNKEDEQNIQILTKKIDNDLNIYDKKNGNILYTYSSGDIVSFHILKEDNGWYTIASEAPIESGNINTDISYQQDDIGYIKIKDIK